MASMDQRIVSALALRLADITVANGYRTNAGLYVDPDDRDPDEETDTFPRLAWSDAVEEVIDDELNLETDAPIADRHVSQIIFTVSGHARIGTASPGDVARPLIADIKQGMIRADDKRLSGLLVKPLRVLGREILWPDPGQKIVSVHVRFGANYYEQAGDPDAKLTN